MLCYTMKETMYTSLTNPSHLSLRPRVIFFGMQGRFSAPVLSALIEQHVEVCAIVLPVVSPPGSSPRTIQRHETPGKRAALPLLHTQEHPSIVEIARMRQIPLWDVYRLSAPETIETLATYQPDLICVACFSQRIPRVILDLLRLGCLNVHPSLLPRNRGPEPLFWVFREGHPEIGVTIHYMEERLDSGDMLVQEAIVVPDGIRYAQLEQQCAEKGGELLARTVWDLCSSRQITRYVQDEAQSSYHPFPGDEDFVVYAQDWNARHVYNFIRGIHDWGHPIEVQVGGIRYLVNDAVSYSLNVNELHAGINVPGVNELDVACRDGWVRAVVA
jgi:methionyl-tRNA formyltransferase